MSVIWNKVWFDLWHNKVRTLLATLSIAAGVFAVGVTFGMADQMLSAMDAAHQATFPAHIQLFIGPGIDRNTAAQLADVEGVEHIDLGNFLMISYKVNAEDEWESAWAIMREDWDEQRYDIDELLQGYWPSDDYLGVDRMSSEYFGIDIGDQVTLQIDDRERAWEINGQIRHPFLPPPQFGGPAVFFIDADGLERFDVPRGRFGYLLVRVDPFSDQHARDIATELKDRLAKIGVTVGGTNFQDPIKHWGRSIMEGINLVLQLMAVVSLGVSVVLILNTLGALITQQTDQIGVIKAIGGRTSTILRMYLAGVLVYGILALVVSLPLGASLAYGISKWLLAFFNINYDTFQISNRTLNLQTVAALVVPLLAALWPVLRGATMTVQEAIASYGLGSGNFGTLRIDKWVERLADKILSAPYAITLGNMIRRKDRFILTQLVLVVAGMMFLVIMSLSSSIDFTLDNDFERRRYDLTVFFDGNERADRSVELASSIEQVEFAEAWYSHSVSILKKGQSSRDAGFGAQLVGIPGDSDVFKPLIVSGRWLLPSDDRGLVISDAAAEDNDIHPGDTITLDVGELGNSDWRVIGVYNDPFGGGVATNDSFYANREAVFSALKQHNRAGQLYVRTNTQNENEAEAIATQLKELFNANNLDADVSQTVYEVRRTIDDQFAIVTSMLLALAIIVAVVGGIGLMGSLSISVVERTREIGVMRAIGASTRTLLGMFVVEGFLQGLISWVIAVPIAFVAGKPLSAALGQAIFSVDLDYQFNLPAVGAWLVLIMVISALASILPARNATRISVRESLAYA